jgi:hypothetical protein
MPGWEFTYFDLWLGKQPPGAVTFAQKRIAELGLDGWEPVGQVDFRYIDQGGREGVVRQVMFKRPL